MRLSAGLVVVGLGLLAFQILFSDGAVPIVVSLPIGMGPLAGGLLSIGVGLLVGLVGGTWRYRAAVLLSLLGTVLGAFGLLFIYTRNPALPAPALTVNHVALALAVVSWGAAIALALDALRRQGRDAGDRRNRDPHGE